MVGGVEGIEHGEVEAAADEHEKHGRKESHQGLDGLLDRLPAFGGTEDQPPGEGAQGCLQAEGLGREAGQREHQEGCHRHLPRRP